MGSFSRSLWVVSWLFITIKAHAQEPVANIALKQLLERVSQAAPSLQTDSSAILIKQAQAVETRHNWLPSLKLNYQTDIGTNNNDAGPYFGFGIIPSNSRGVRTNSNTQLVSTNIGVAALDWEIYNFGAYGAQNRVAKSDVEVQQHQFTQSKYQLQAFTIGNYFQLARLMDCMAIQVRNIQRNEEIKRSIESLTKSGVRAGVDTSMAEAELSKARLNYIELLNQSKQVQLNLAAISNLSYERIMPDTSAVTRLTNNFPHDHLNAADTANHPLINYYKSIYQNNLKRENLIRKSYSPKILLEGAVWGRGASIDANDHFNSLSDGFNLNRTNYLLGLGISYNIFDISQRKLKLSTQRMVTHYSQRKLQEEAQILSTSNDQAKLALNTAMQRLKEIPNQLKAANAAYRQKLSLYKNGLTDIIELNIALNILYRAETDYVNAKYSYVNALFQKAIAENQVNTVLNLLN